MRSRGRAVLAAGISPPLMNSLDESTEALRRCRRIFPARSRSCQIQIDLKTNCSARPHGGKNSVRAIQILQLWSSVELILRGG
jgi:hypothetical protein